jgi:hypothetical protein
MDADGPKSVHCYILDLGVGEVVDANARAALSSMHTTCDENITNCKSGNAVIQDITWAASILLMACIAALFVWVAIGASVTATNSGLAAAGAYRLRPWLCAIAILVIVVANYKTLRELPYVSAVSAERVTAVQKSEAIAE